MKREPTLVFSLSFLQMQNCSLIFVFYSVGGSQRIGFDQIGIWQISDWGHAVALRFTCICSQ